MSRARRLGLRGGILAWCMNWCCWFDFFCISLAVHMTFPTLPIKFSADKAVLQTCINDAMHN